MSESQTERSEDREDERCKPHGNRLPCPRCLAELYKVPVWNNV